MIRSLSTAALLLLVACGDGQPFDLPVEEEEEADADGGRFGGDGTAPPGTEGAEAGPNESLLRSEARDEDGGGFVTEVIYSAASDSFTVDNIAFDGDNTYTRRSDLDNIGEFAFYESAGDVIDPRSGARVDQFDYRAIYGVSRNTERVDGKSQPRTRFAIVRTGGYLDYGFGGFIYERNGGVELPDGGQAVFAGDYSGMRVFSDRAGLEYTRGTADIAVDFADFNDGGGVRGRISNRRVFDSGGRPVGLGGGDDGLVAPDLVFDVGPETLRDNGEIGGTLQSIRVLEDNTTETYETGTYLGIIGGEAEEIVGIVVIDSTDPRFEGTSVRETGGFIVYR